MLFDRGKVFKILEAHTFSLRTFYSATLLFSSAGLWGDRMS
jgi:hypothetical protein